MAEIYDIGDTPRITETFTDLSSVVTDPTTVTCRVKAPDGTATLYTYPSAQLTKTSTGVYNLDLLLTQSGQYGFIWTGSGAGAAGQGVLLVRKSVG